MAWDLETCEEPSRAWHLLREARPDLVLLDVDMTGMDGIELCAALRADASTATMAVLFLTSATDPETIGRMFEAGADDYVHKPVAGPELVSRIGIRLERTRLMEEAVGRDPVTGLQVRSHVHESATVLLRDSAARGEPASVVCVLVDDLAAVNDVHGHAVGDAVLERVAGLLQDRTGNGHGLAWRTGGAELGAVLIGHRRADAVQRIATALEELREATFADRTELVATFSAGVAEHAEDAGGLRLHGAAASASLHAGFW